VKLLEAAKVRLAAAIAAQKKAIAAQKAAMDRVLNDKARLAAAVAALKAEEAQVKSIVDRLLKQQFGSTLPILYQGGWTWPIARTAAGFVQPKNGYRPYISQKYGCVSWKIYPRSASRNADLCRGNREGDDRWHLFVLRGLEGDAPPRLGLDCAQQVHGEHLWTRRRRFAE
jgi:hypothetical protein